MIEPRASKWLGKNSTPVYASIPRVCSCDSQSWRHKHTQRAVLFAEKTNLWLLDTVDTVPNYPSATVSPLGRWRSTLCFIRKWWTVSQGVYTGGQSLVNEAERPMFTSHSLLHVVPGRWPMCSWLSVAHRNMSHSVWSPSGACKIVSELLAAISIQGRKDAVTTAKSFCGDSVAFVWLSIWFISKHAIILSVIILLRL